MNSIGKYLLVAAVSVSLAGAAGYQLGMKRGAAAANAAGPEGHDGRLIGKAMRPEDGAAGEKANARGAAGATAGLPLPDATAADTGTINEIFARPGPLARWHHMMQLALSADESERANALKELSVAGATDEVDAALAALFLYSAEARDDPEAAIDAMLEADNDDWGSEYIAGRAIMSTWASRDPEAAGAFIIAESEKGKELSKANGEMVGAVAREWSKQNPEAAFQWSLQLGKDDQDGALEGVLTNWVARAPQEAAAFAEQNLPRDLRKGMYDEMAEQWARSDYRAALRWARELPANEGGRAVASALDAWAKEDPRSAAATFSAIALTENRDRSMAVIATHWAKESPREAIDWILAQPGEENDRKRAIQPAVYHWARKDSMAASEWLANQPSGPVTDKAIDALSRAVVNSDPEAATIWAMATSEKKARVNLVKSSVKLWLNDDYRTAAAWIESSGLSADLKDELLSGKKKKTKN